jgi:DNA ligase (NAD+)
MYIDASEYKEYKKLVDEQYTSLNVRVLEDELRDHSSSYYNADVDRTIPDWQYEIKKDRLMVLNPSSRFFFEVGSKPTTDIKVKHLVKMLSLDKIRMTDVSSWLRYKPSDLIAEVKLDGVSLSVEYTNGAFYRASTRGDGEYGEDVTRHARCIESIPKTIPTLRRYSSAIIRGEVVITKSVFNERFGDSSSNPRNTAAGLLRRLETHDSDTLDFYAFNFVGDLPFKWQWEVRNFLVGQGFKVVDGERLYSLKAIEDFYSKWASMREDYWCDYDGVVVKIDNIAEQGRIGVGPTSPKYAFCLKFDAKGAYTTINDIVWQVGRTGVITPVALVEPVLIDNVSITRITMDNHQMIKKFRLCKGDKVYVIRANDVIPKIIDNDTKHTMLGSDEEMTDTDFQPPVKCPVCGVDTKIVGPKLFCSSSNCEAQSFQYLKHFIKVNKILGIGDEILQALMGASLVEDPVDFYDLSPPKMEHIMLTTGVIGWKRAEAICEEIINSKIQELDKFIWSLGIPLIGEGKAKDLAKYVGNINEFMNVIGNGSLQLSLHNIQGFSHETINGMFDAIDIIIPRAKALLGKVTVKPWGKTIDSVESSNLKAPGFGGMKFAITGTLSERREDFIKIIEDSGGIFTKNPVRGTTALILGDSPGNNKIELATKNGVPTLTESEFISALGQPNMIKIIIQGKEVSNDAMASQDLSGES